MAFLGRETDADRVRAERFRQWIHARSPYALASMLFGVVAVLDAFTLVLGVAAGLAAVVVGVLGLRDLAERRHLLGARLCAAGIVFGVLGIGLSIVMWAVVYPSLAGT